MKFWMRSTHSAAVMLMAIFLSQVKAQTPSRVPVTIQTEPRFALTRNTPPRIASATDLGPVDDSFMLPRITMHFRLTDAQQRQLDQLVRDQQDRASANYHKWLTPDEFGRRFGLNEADLAAVRSWLESQGFTVIDTAPGRNMMTFSGTAKQVRDAFGTAIHRYRRGNESHYSNSSDPELPAVLGGVVQSLRGLDDFRPPPALATAREGNLLAPADFAILYDLQPLFAQGVNGTGQTIAIAGGSALSNLALSQLQTFRVLTGLPPLNLQIVEGTRPAGVVEDWVGEAMLDIEWAGASAPGASILYVNADTAIDAMFYAVQQNLAPVVSASYVECELFAGEPYVESMASIFQQGVAQGITMVAAAGDAGPAACDWGNTTNAGTLGYAVSAPSSIPFVTAVGGTQFNEGSGTYWSSTNSPVGGSVLSYIPEAAWSLTALNGTIESGGGGRSIFFSKPAWQQGSNVPADSSRDVPDLSLTASSHDAYVVCEDIFPQGVESASCINGFLNQYNLVGGDYGTSASAPAFAGMVALLNQVYGRQGNINPELYQLASFSPDAFHDVTTGEITAACKPGTTDCPSSGVLSLPAGPGYDLATGLGSVDAFHFVDEWASDFQLSEASPAGGRSGLRSAAEIAVDAIGNFPGTIDFTCAIQVAAPGWECTVSGPVQGSGSVTVGVKRTGEESASRLVLLEPLTVSVTGTSGLLSHSISVDLRIAPLRRAESVKQLR